MVVAKEVSQKLENEQSLPPPLKKMRVWQRKDISVYDWNDETSHQNQIFRSWFQMASDDSAKLSGLLDSGAHRTVF
jgi:hypothetical protein